MGLTKSEAFSLKQNELASYAKALAHPARVAILEHLIQEDKCICGELVDILPLAQPTVSQHLVELKKAGLIKGTISGTSMCYCLDKTEWAKCIASVEALFDQVKSVTNCCS
jgi:DNA-binding transcriptional ArsR family regulator